MYVFEFNLRLFNVFFPFFNSFPVEIPSMTNTIDRYADVYCD